MTQRADPYRPMPRIIIAVVAIVGSVCTFLGAESEVLRLVGGLGGGVAFGIILNRCGFDMQAQVETKRREAWKAFASLLVPYCILQAAVIAIAGV